MCCCAAYKDDSTVTGARLFKKLLWTALSSCCWITQSSSNAPLHRQRSRSIYWIVGSSQACCILVQSAECCSKYKAANTISLRPERYHLLPCVTGNVKPVRGNGNHSKAIYQSHFPPHCSRRLWPSAQTVHVCKYSMIIYIYTWIHILQDGSETLLRSIIRKYGIRMNCFSISEQRCRGRKA